MRAICYPTTFLARPEDRLLLSDLRQAGLSPESAEVTLYRVWRDFANGASDRRDLRDVRHRRLLEEGCGWSGEPGLLVELALQSGFLELSEGLTVLKDFYPINSGIGNGGPASFQRRGALQSSLNRQKRRAIEEVRAMEQIWARTGGEPGGLPEERRKEAALLTAQICRAMGLALPGPSEMKALTIAADQMLEKFRRENREPETELTLRWLISRRRDPALPKDAGKLVAQWEEWIKEAKREEG